MCNLLMNSSRLKPYGGGRGYYVELVAVYVVAKELLSTSLLIFTSTELDRRSTIAWHIRIGIIDKAVENFI